MMRATAILAAALVIACGACSEKYPIPKEPLTLASGTKVEVDTLQSGQIAFMHYCYACHGPYGDGHGPSAYSMRPPPRDFRMGLFKFAGAPAGGVPSDEALDRTIRRGLQGTPMLPWDTSPIERKEIIQYLKSFKCVKPGATGDDLKSRFEKETAAPIEISQDPWKGKEAQAIELGKQVYHVSGADQADTSKIYAGCASCHASYATKQEMYEMSKKITGTGVTEFREDLYHTQTRESEYGLSYDENCEAQKKYMVLPPDFLFNKLKTVWPIGTEMVNDPRDADGKVHVYTAADQREDLYRVIAAGIGGAAMPQWKGTLSEEYLWALAYYVQSLVNLRETAAAYALRDKLEHQAEFKAPEEAPAPEEKKPGEAPKK